MKKYLVIADYIVSSTDGQWHWISCQKLMKLYNVNPSECVCIEPSDPKGLHGINTRDLIVLRPQNNGNYTIYDNKKRGGEFR